jgi:hypothetical protein
MSKVNITLIPGSKVSWHPANWPVMLRRKDVVDRFWERVDVAGENGCWLWKGSTNGRGYGLFSIQRSRIRAHRASWMLAHGSLPEHLEVCHNCDVPCCVNPDHLRLDTHIGNMHESVRKGRKKTWGLQKLTADDVVVIKQMVAAGALHREAAAQYGVTRSCVSTIMNGKSWGHLGQIGD